MGNGLGFFSSSQRTVLAASSASDPTPHRRGGRLTMLTWLADEPTLAYFVLGIVALVAGMSWWMNRQRWSALVFLSALLLIGVVWALGRFLVTDAGRIRMTLDEISRAVSGHHGAAIFANISDRFELGRCGKEDFRGIVERYVDQGEVSGLSFSQFEVRDLSRASGMATVRFTVFPAGRAVPEGSVYRCEGRFRRDGDGRWRLQTFKLSYPPIDPAVGPNIQIPINC